MFTTFLITVIITIITVAIHEIKAGQFKLSITKDLQTARQLDREKWTHVEVIETDLPENDNVLINLEVPLSIPYSGASIFFANDVKEILQVYMNETLQGKFYAMPYKVEKEMSGQNLTVLQEVSFRKISGIFPRSWLPRSPTKISAAVTDVDGNFYNYYGLKNFQISIPDLLVVEEYKTYVSSA